MTTTESTVRQNVYADLKTFIDTYKTTDWNVFASFPESNPSYPCIIINPAAVSYDIDGIQVASRQATISVVLELFSRAKYTAGNVVEGQKGLDIATDDLIKDIWAQEDTLQGYGLYVIDVDDTVTDTVYFNENKLYHKSITLMFQLKGR